MSSNKYTRTLLSTLLVAVGGCAIDGTSAARSARRLAPVGGESKYLSDIEQITFSSMGLVNAGEAYFSPDGNTIIFQATPKGKSEYQIYTLDLPTRHLRMVSTGHGACTCAFFHPGGKKIIFASSHLDPDADKPKEKPKGRGYTWDFNAFMDIFEADPDGSNLKRLTDAPGYDAEGSYSTDGKRIVFTSNRDGDLEIYAMNADGSDQKRLTNGEGYDGGPFFSPDGKTILYRGDRRRDDKMNLQLRMVNADGSNDRALTDNPIFNWCPYWYPSGKSFIFTQTDHEAYARSEKPNYDLFMTALPAGTAASDKSTAGLLSAEKMIRITFDPAFDGLPVFSPDGKRLMWTSRRGGLEEPQIFIADFRVPDEWR